MSLLRKAMRSLLLALLLVLSAALPAQADDIDIYSNPAANTLRPPMTIISLDLSLLAICDNVITNPNANATCGALRSTLTLQSYLNLIGGNGVLSAGLAGLPQATLCQLNALLPVPIVSQLLCPLLNALGLTNLVNGLSNNVLNSTGVLLSALPAATLSILDAALSAPRKVLADPTQLLAVIQSLLTPLINSRVAIILSHANRSNAAGTPVTIGGASYACNFADLATIPGTRASTTPCSNGAYFLLGFTSLADPAAVISALSLQITNALNPANLVASLNGLSLTPANLTPPYQGKEIYAEIAHYLDGAAVYNAPLKSFDGLLALLGRDTAIEQGANYRQPNALCDSVNVLNVQASNASGDGDSDAELLRNNYFPAADRNANGLLTFPEVVSEAQTTGFTSGGSLIKLNSFFLLQDNLSSLAALQSIGSNVLSYANAAGLLGLGQSVARFLQPVLVIDASLVSAVVATSRSSSSGLLEPSYFAQFQPKTGQKPGWAGNLKRLQFARNAAGVLAFRDASGTAAIASDGRIASSALTVWTRSSQLGGASADGRNTQLGGAGQNIPGYQFGGGGNPGRINADARRQLFYDTLSAGNVPSLAALDADSQTVRDALKTDLGVPGATAADDTLRRALLLHARGFNVGTTASPVGTGSGLTGVSGRPWLLGALLHSRPVAVNYGARSGYTAAAPDIRVLFGSSDGYLHSVRNGTAASPSGAEDWAFMPRATMASLKTLRDDQYSPQFPYGVDGSPSVLVIDRGTSTSIAGGGPADGIINSSNANDHVYAFVGMRRGGRHYYGLDITNPDTPSLIWRLGPEGLYSATASTPGLVSGSATQFAELAMTFGTPVVGRMQISTGPSTVVTRPVLLFGGGYNGGVNASGVRLAKDLNNSRNAVATAQVGVDDASGNALFIIDAVTGELIWKAMRSAGTSITAYDSSSRSFRHPLLQDGIASDVTALDTDGDGLTDRLYVGDTGGRIWRADFPGSDRSAWTMGPIASLGRGHPVGAALPDTDNTNDRRFLHAPDYVPARDASGSFDAVVIGSGDREDPFNTATGNWLYTIRDRDTASGKTLTDTGVNGVIASEADSRLIKPANLADITTACATASGTACAAGATATNGWRLQLSASGEKAVSAPVTIGNTVSFSSFLPPPVGGSSCSPSEGTSRIYGISLIDGRPSVSQFINDGDGNARSGAAKAPGIAGEVGALTPQLTVINAETLNTTVPLIYRTFWRERREDEERPVAQ